MMMMFLIDRAEWGGEEQDVDGKGHVDEYR